MRANKIFGLAAVTLIALGVAQAVHARNMTSNPYRTPCHDDRLRLCSKVAPGNAGKCLRQHLNDLEPACKAFVTKKKG